MVKYHKDLPETRACGERCPLAGAPAPDVEGGSAPAPGSSTAEGLGPQLPARAPGPAGPASSGQLCGRGAPCRVAACPARARLTLHRRYAAFLRKQKSFQVAFHP